MKTRLLLEELEIALLRRGFSFDSEKQRWTRPGCPKNVFVSQQTMERLDPVDRTILLNKVDILIQENP